MPYANPEDRKARNQKWRRENRAHLNQYREENQFRIAQQHREWRKKNLKRRAASMRKWRENQKNRLASNVRSRIANALKGRTKISDTVSLVGCSLEQLRLWLVQQFRPEMTWENYGPVWEIDHVRPCDSFNFEKPEEQRECFHYLNMQPLFKRDNRRKGNRVYGK